jgi:hypothetical protein
MRFSLRAWFVLAAALGSLSWCTLSRGCPFCGTVDVPLAQQRDAAESVAIGEAAGEIQPATSGKLAQPFRIQQLIRPLASFDARVGAIVPAEVAGRVVGTALLLGSAREPGKALRWSAIPADETLLGHALAAPSAAIPAATRLEWFASRLWHPDPRIAADALAEFAAAPFAAVVAAAGALDAKRLGAAVSDPGISQGQRGFFGLALGIVAATTASPEERAACLAALHAAIEAPADDFRAGFAGILAGELVAEGEQGLDYLRGREFLSPAARPIDQRHLLSALRFAWENLAEELPPSAVAAATLALAESPAVAAEAIVDLARYGAWEGLESVAAIWHTAGADDPQLRRAVAGYLSVCPLLEAREQITSISSKDPQRWAEALEAAALPRAETLP